MFQLLLNGEIYTPEPTGRGHLLICDGRVVWAGRDRLDLPAGLDVTVTDLGGARVIPGLVDGHVHVTGGGGEAGFDSRLGPVSAGDLLAAGITSVVGLLGTDDTTRTTEDLLATVRGLCGQGVSAWCFTGGYHIPPATLTGSVRGDLIHLDRVIGVGEIALSDHRSSGPTVDELIRVAGDAYVGGMLSGKAGLTHFHMGDGSAELAPVREMLVRSDIPPRVIQPTHVNRNRALFQASLKLAEFGCPIDITALPADDDAMDAAQALMTCLDAGLPPERISVSSDAGGSLPLFDKGGRLTGYSRQEPGTLARTLAALLEAGRSMESVLPAFTSSPAGTLKLEGKGHLRPGADADLITLDENNNIDGVMSGGQWRINAKQMTGATT